MGKRNPVAEKDHTPLTTGQKSDERPPAARKKSIRASLGRAASKLIGKEVEKWKPFTADDGRTYYINQDTNESVWEIPAGGDGEKGNSKFVPAALGAACHCGRYGHNMSLVLFW